MEERIRSYLSGMLHSGKEKKHWLVTFLSLALAVVLTTSTILTLTGVAVTEERAGEVGIVTEKAEPDEAVLSDETTQDVNAVGAGEVSEENMLAAGPEEALLTGNENTASLDLMQAEEVSTAEENYVEAASAENDEAVSDSVSDPEAANDSAEDSAGTAAESSANDNSESAGDASSQAGMAAESEQTSENAEAAALYPAAVFSGETDTLQVVVEADEGTFPAGTTMSVTPVEAASVEEAVSEAVDGTVARVDAVDISFYDVSGQKIEPLQNVRVAIQPKVVSEYKDPQVVHVADNGTAEVMEQVDPAVMGSISAFANEAYENDTAANNEAVADVNSTRDQKEADNIAFETASFSVYAVVYTVDFHYEVNGKKYDFSIPGGGFMSLEHLVEMLEIAKPDADADSSADDKSIDQKDAEISAETKMFVKDVESVEFSNPELIWAGKVEKKTTIGSLKDTNKLNVEYSAQLTAAKIADINDSTVEAGDWALISLKPFTSEETLTVTMKNGNVFEIHVTDAMDNTKPYDKGTTFTGYDNTIDGLTVNLFNYGPEDKLDAGTNNINGTVTGDGINQYTTLKFTAYGQSPWDKTTDNKYILSQNHFSGGDAATQGIVGNYLSDDGKGFPVLADGSNTDLHYFFDTETRNGKTNYLNTIGLFQKDANGMLRYDSNVNYARYTGSGNNGSFELSDTFPEEGSEFGVGFFPFSDWNGSKNCIHWDDYCPSGSSQKGYYDHHFGMTLEGSFRMTGNGYYNNNPMKYNFSGDDDMWVFIDGVLVLDMGGVHNPVGGYIDFSTNNGNGTVHVGSAYTVNSEIEKCATNAKNQHPIDDVTIADRFAAAGKVWDPTPGKIHDIKIFYMERGGCYSNLMMEINLPFVHIGDVEFDKTDEEGNALAGAEFTLYDADNNEVATVASDVNGKVRFENIETGTYTMRETHAPEGFQPNEETYTVIIENKKDSSKHSVVKKADGTTVTSIANESKKITLSVNKKWLDADGNEILDPSGYSATFKAQRLKSWIEKNDPKPVSTSTLKIGYYGWSNYLRRDVYTVTDETYTFVAGTKVNIPYTYNWGYNSRYDSKGYRLQQNGTWYELEDEDGVVELTMPDSGEMIIYFYDGWRANGQYYYGTDRALTVGDVSGTTAADIPQEPLIVEHTDEEDTTFSRTLTLSGGYTSGIFDGAFPLQETKEGITYTYKYYITEEPVEGFNSTSGGHYSSDEDFTETFENRKKPHPTPTDIDVDEQPKHSKQLTENYVRNASGEYILDKDGHKMWDGTYTLSLDVTGKAVSAQESSVNKADIILVLDMSSSMTNEVEPGTTRLDVEKAAVRQFGTDLLNINNKTPDTVHLSVLTFGSDAQDNHDSVGKRFIVDRTDQVSVFQKAIDGMVPPPPETAGAKNGGQGTNWEDALHRANSIPVRSDAEKFVIFVSDGLPTLRNTRGPHDTNEKWSGATMEGNMHSNSLKTGFLNYGYDVWGFGTEKLTDQFLDDNPLLSLGDKEVVRLWLKDAIGFCYDEAKKEARQIVKDGKNFYSISVFEDIDRMETIAAYAYSESDSGSYPEDRYKTAKTASDFSKIFKSLFQTASKAVDFRNVKIIDPMTAAAKTTASITGTPVDFKYYKVTKDAEDHEIVTEWVGGPQATYVGNGTGGSIEWDISAQTDSEGNALQNPLKNGALENDVTYRVSFTVWPNQNAYDAVLKLNEANGDQEKIKSILEQYPDVAESIVKTADGQYTIYSNGEDAKVTFTQYVDNEPKHNGELYYNRPVMETLPYTMKVAKVWNDSLYDKNRLEKVKFTIFEDGKEYKIIELDESNASAGNAGRWEATIPVSPGIQSDQVANGVKLNKGHKYTVTEQLLIDGKWQDTDFHYEFDPEEVTPVFKNGTMIYEGDTNGDVSLTGINHMRGSVTITKQIIDEDGNVITTDLPEEDFVFKITLKDPDGNEIKGKTQNDADAIWYKRLKDDGTEMDEVTVINSGDTFTLKAGHSLRLINVPLGVTYKIEETDSNSYVLDSMLYTYKDEEHTQMTNQSPDKNGMYTACANTWHYVTAKNKEEIIPDAGFGILKVSKGTTNPLEKASFTIQPVQETSNTTTVAVVDGSEPSAPKTTGKDGKVSFENIAPGYYAVKETNTPDGYIITGEDTFYIKVDKSGVKLLRKIVTDTEEKKSVTFEEAAEENGKIRVGNVTITAESGNVLFTVENEPGTPLPHTGGPGTRLFTILGSILILGAGLLLWRRRRRTI